LLFTSTSSFLIKYPLESDIHSSAFPLFFTTVNLAPVNAPPSTSVFNAFILYCFIFGITIITLFASASHSICTPSGAITFIIPVTI